MALSRRFQFFESGPLRDPATGEAYRGLAELDALCCWSCGRGLLAFGDKNGYVHLIGRSAAAGGSGDGFARISFRAYDESTNLLHQFSQHDVLITVGLDQGVDEQRLKVWSQLDRSEAEGGPQCCRVMRVALDTAGAVQQPHQMPFVTCLTAHENLSCMALGFSTGAVQLHRGDVKKERHSRSKIILDAERPVTNLHVKVSDDRVTTVFATTERAVFALLVTAKDHVTKVCLENEFGASPCCTCLTESDPDPQLVVANRSVAYFFNMDGRGACTAFDMEIEQLRWFRSYLVALGKRGLDQSQLSQQQQQQQQSHKPLAAPAASALKDTHMLTVYEPRHKFSAMYSPFRGVRAVLAEWGGLLLLAKSPEQRLLCLTEKDASAKMAILFKKNNFRLAIDLAGAMRYNEEGMAEIYRQYADYLYQKGDYDAAIPQYCKTIGHLEASYVIRKFLDSARIHNLTAYLEDVHHHRLASSDHTTLLLNCYSKLKDEEKLNAFLESAQTAFDADTAIRVLRQAGFGKQALALADRFGRHEWHLKIQVCDLGQHAAALKYMSGLPPAEAMNNMRLYGRELLAACPSETTDLLKTLVGSPQVSVGVDELAPIFVGNPGDLIAILEHCLSLLGSPTARPQLTQTLLELYIQRLATSLDGGEANGHDAADAELRAERERRALALLESGADCYDADALLLRCYLAGFWPGVLLLSERTGRYDLLLRHYTEQKRHDKLLQLCESVGHRHKDLWRQALLYFARSDEPDAPQYLDRVLRYTRSTGLMTPLAIVSLLCGHTQATVGAVADFLVEHLREEAAQAEEDERLVEQARARTQALQRQMEELQLQPKVFQNQRCSICNSPLDIPSVHFLCDHSFHLHCFQSFSETEAECPNCAAENREAIEAVSVWRSQSGDSAARLLDNLSQARPDATFSIISDSIAKGVFWNGTSAATTTSAATVLPAAVVPPAAAPSVAAAASANKLPPTSSSTNPFDVVEEQQDQSPTLRHSASAAGGMRRAGSPSSLQQQQQQQRQRQLQLHKQPQNQLSSSVGSAASSAYPDRLNPFGNS